jgi:prepilin-type N-terminal cleavage/methylation domain-containing protein
MNAKTRRGYTLIELLVVTGISVLLMTVLAFIYSNALKVYNESQGMQEVFEASKIINRDLRDAFANVVPVPGGWINPQTMKFPGNPDATTATLDWRYLDSSGGAYADWTEYLPHKNVVMTNNVVYDTWFSKSQRPQNGSDLNFAWAGLGYFKGGWGSGDSASWKDTPANYSGGWAWWMPAFFGQRDASTTALLQSNDIMAGSWGWPRADYRMDVDLDNLPAHGNMACWFYSEYKNYRSPGTLALDNANIVLISIKFSRKLNASNKEETQLSFLRHQIVGLDIESSGKLREDQSTFNMIRQIKITPYCLDAGGAMKKMDDNALGASITGAPAGAGDGVPRAFDIEYTLRNRVNMQPYHFAMRVFCATNPQ